MSTTLSKTQIWGAPIALAIVSAVGLMTALLADGLWDAVSWMALAAPVALSVWYGTRPRPVFLLMLALIRSVARFANSVTVNLTGRCSDE